jgi:plastocyanin
MPEATRRRLAGLVLVLLLAAAGCGSDDGAGVRNVDATGGATGSGSASGSASGPGSGSASAAAACKPVGDAATADTKVAVELKEWAILPKQASAKAGTITFESANVGKDAHELVIARADDPANLPTGADGTVDEAKLPQGAMIGEVEAFPAGETCPGTFELRPGRYALFCNLLEQEGGTTENHYKLGMRTSFEVTG